MTTSTDLLRLRVPWWPVEFDLGVDDPAGLRWAEHHWYQHDAPAFEPVSAVAITTRTAPDVVAVARKGVHLGEVAAFDDPGYFVGVRTAEGPGLLHAGRPGEGALLVRTRGGREHWSVFVEGRGAAAQLDKRLAAEIIRRELAGRGHVQLHAAAVSSGAQGVLLVGGSGAGKTTAALGLARHGALLSGDRINVQADDDGVRTGAFPDAVRLGFGTAAGLGVHDRLLAADLVRAQDFRLPDGSLDPDRLRPGSRRKISLSRLEVTELLGLRVAGSAPVTDLVVLRGRADVARPVIREVPGADVAQDVIAQDMALRGAYVPWLDAGQADAPDRRERVVRELLGRVRVWRADWTPSVAATAELADALFHR